LPATGEIEVLLRAYVHLCVRVSPLAYLKIYGCA